jgi:hypothetical protein
MMIITIIISVVAILELIWIIYLCNRISFIKWSHNYWVNAYFREVDKRIDFEHQLELECKLCKKRYGKI